jgi:hypothetical protein
VISRSLLCVTTDTHRHTQTHRHTDTSAPAHPPTHTHSHTHSHSHTHTKHTQTHTPTHKHTHTHTHTHTRTHTNTQVFEDLGRGNESGSACRSPLTLYWVSFDSVLVVFTGLFLIFFPCNHIINKKIIIFFLRRSKRQRIFCLLFFTS